MNNNIKQEELTFDDSVKVNDKGEVILGRLRGPVAEFIAPTRNERMYDEATWDAVFKKPLVKEMFESGGLLGELNHPEDRLETDLSKVCVCMPEPPKKNNDGTLTATFDILATPNGRIVYTLAKYGYKLGVSSRADGDVYQDIDGLDHVNSDTFDLKGFDIVLLPAVKKARLSLTESLNKNNDIKKELAAQLSEMTSEEKQIMMESLNDLNINISEQAEEIVNKDTVDDRAEIIVQLQEALKDKRNLSKQVEELQQKLSVCYAKESKLDESLSRYKSSLVALSDKAKSVKGLKEHNASLSEKLSSKETELSTCNKKMSALTEKLEKVNYNNQKLSEDLKLKNKQIEELTESINSLKQDADTEKQKLQESIEDIKKDYELVQKKYNAKVNESNKVVEHYKKVASHAVNHYIDLRASMIGVSASEIKGKLNETYTLDDVDAICEDLRSYHLNIKSLPFDVNDNKSRIVVKESREPIKPKFPGVDDEVDDDLIRLAGLK